MRENLVLTNKSRLLEPMISQLAAATVISNCFKLFSALQQCVKQQENNYFDDNWFSYLIFLANIFSGSSFSDLRI